MSKGFKTNYLKIIVIALVLVYVVYQIYQITYSPVKTVTVTEDTVYDSVTADAIFIRDEDVVTSELNGTMVYNVKDGTRVEKGGVIANVFSSEAQANSYSQLNDVEKQIRYYENIILQTNAGSASLEVIDSNIDGSVNNYIRTVSSGWLENADEQSAEMIDYINNRKVTVGEDIDVNSILNELYAQRKNLESNITGNDAVKADKAGYFVSAVDGNESAVDYGKATELSVSNIQNILDNQNKAKDNSSVGKIIVSFDWYVACVVKEQNILGLEEGSRVSVNFPESEAGELDAVIVAINQDAENSGKVALILKLDNMDENIARIRSDKVEVRFNKYSGIKIPNSALRAVTIKEEGEEEKTVKCVYVLSGNIVKRKLVDVIFNGEDYVLAKSNTSEAGYVRLYDRVITKGEDLSDGKIVKYTPAD